MFYLMIEYYHFVFIYIFLDQGLGHCKIVYFDEPEFLAHLGTNNVVLRVSFSDLYCDLLSFRHLTPRLSLKF